MTRHRFYSRSQGGPREALKPAGPKVRTEPAVFRVDEAFGDFREDDRLLVHPDADSPFALWRPIPAGGMAGAVLRAWAEGRLRLESSEPPKSLRTQLNRLAKEEAPDGYPPLQLVR